MRINTVHYSYWNNGDYICDINHKRKIKKGLKNVRDDLKLIIPDFLYKFVGHIQKGTE